MPKKADLVGKQFGKWKVLSEGESRDGNLYWLCECECGTKKYVGGYSLVSGDTKSCGCVSVKHRLTNHRFFQTWANMNHRCYDEKNKRYQRYGGRGITVYEEWRYDPTAFLAW